MTTDSPRVFLHNPTEGEAAPLNEACRLRVEELMRAYDHLESVCRINGLVEELMPQHGLDPVSEASQYGVAEGFITFEGLKSEPPTDLDEFRRASDARKAIAEIDQTEERESLTDLLRRNNRAA